MVFVCMQMETTLAVYLRDVHRVPEQGFGLLLSLNAAMVVLFQIPITRQIRRHRPLMVMAAGTLLYAVGFSIYGFVSTYVLFLVAMVIITTGEMLTVPTSQTVVARWHRRTCAGGIWPPSASVMGFPSCSEPCWPAWSWITATPVGYGTEPDCWAWLLLPASACCSGERTDK